ncbi:hypothetical protein JCM9279_002613 [Rhodotorula babjevae]
MLQPLRNPYATPVDYAQLAQAVPALAPFLRPARDGRQTIDFRDDAAVRALNAALLKRDFGLDLILPHDRLCPAVPSRLEYVLFVLHLALATLDRLESSTSSRPLVGLDIGTGASAIYPLLAMRTLEPPPVSLLDKAKVDAPLRMLATDIDAHSLEYARKNVRANDLVQDVSLCEVEPDGALFPLEVVEAADTIDFVMCNPPFYSSQDEIDSSLAAKEIEPFAKCTGAENEMITPGGEVAFVSRMIEESLKLGRSRIRWFTSLLGKYSSLSPLVELLKSKEIFNYHVHALPPHGHTVRWVLAWSLRDRRFPYDLLSSASSSTATPSSPPSSSAPRFSLSRYASPATTSITYFTPALEADPLERMQRVADALDEVLRELGGGSSAAARVDAAPLPDDERAPKRRRVGERARDDAEATATSALEWRWDEPSSASSSPRDGEDGSDGARAAHAELVVVARRNVWSRKARRAAAAPDPAPATAASSSPPRSLLELRLLVDLEPSPSAQARLTAHWVRGLDADRAAFTGLVGFVTRKVGERLKGEREAGVERARRGEEGREGDEV